MTITVAALMFTLFGGCDHLPVPSGTKFADSRFHIAYHVLRGAEVDGLLVGGWTAAADSLLDHTQVTAYAAAAFGQQLLSHTLMLGRQIQSGELEFAQGIAGDQKLAAHKRLVQKIAFYASRCENILAWYGAMAPDDTPVSAPNGRAFLAQTRTRLPLVEKHLLRGLRRVYTFRPGVPRPKFLTDETRQIEWVEIGGLANGGVGHGAEGGGGVVWNHSDGRIGFAGGGVEDCRSIATHRGLGSGAAVTSVSAEFRRDSR